MKSYLDHLPLEAALHAGGSVGADADLNQGGEERQEAGQDGEPGAEVEVAQGEGWRVNHLKNINSVNNRCKGICWSHWQYV